VHGIILLVGGLPAAGTEREPSAFVGWCRLGYHFPTKSLDYLEQQMSAFDKIDATVKGNPVVLYMKGTPSFPMCGFSGTAVQILKACGVDQITAVNVLEDDEVRQGIKDYANWPTIPQLYVNGEFIGGADIMREMYQSGELQALLGGKPA
jgi:monothiol glutaredoxin